MIAAPSTAATAVRHERRGSPSTSTVQVPQPPCWQPAFGLVMSSSSRSTCRSGVSGGLEISCSTPLTVRFIALSSWSSARRTSTGRTARRYAADATASSTGSTSFEHVVGGRGSPRRRGSAPPSGRRRDDADAQVAVGGRADGDGRDRVRVRVAAAQRCAAPAPAERSYAMSSTSRPRGRRRGSPRPAPSARRPRRSSGPARRARSAARRGRRAATRARPARRGCRRRSRCARTSRSATWRRRVRAARRRVRERGDRRPSRRS